MPCWLTSLGRETCRLYAWLQRSPLPVNIYWAP